MVELKRRWYCVECHINGIHKYYDSKEELLEAHPALKRERGLIYSEVYDDDK